MSADNAQRTAPPTNPSRQRKRRRWRSLALLFLVIVLVAAAWVAWDLLHARWYESTDDAYVGGNIVQITPRTGGTITAINADDNDRVEHGQVLVELDPSDTETALAQAKAALGQAVREVSGLYNGVTTARAQVAVQEAALRRARADFERRRTLAKSGAVSGEELAHAQDALTQAQSLLAAAQAGLATAEARVAGTTLENHPDVLAAVAQLRQAWLDRQRTAVPAPVAGYVAMRSAQVGQHVQAGEPLMAVVPLDQVWVDANFKETQLRHMRIGQPVSLTADLYGGAITYHGHIAGLGIGTGSAFSLLPAQNATGNWIKIVQRLPVRITLDPDELAKHPLRIGLSMTASVNLHDRSGPELATQAARGPMLATDVYDPHEAALDALVADIIAHNRGQAR